MATADANVELADTSTSGVSWFVETDADPTFSAAVNEDGIVNEAASAPSFKNKRKQQRLSDQE